jgi:hypothetical protein
MHSVWCLTELNIRETTGGDYNARNPRNIVVRYSYTMHDIKCIVSSGITNVFLSKIYHFSGSRHTLTASPRGAPCPGRQGRK